MTVKTPAVGLRLTRSMLLRNELGVQGQTKPESSPTLNRSAHRDGLLCNIGQAVLALADQSPL